MYSYEEQSNAYLLIYYLYISWIERRLHSYIGPYLRINVEQLWVTNYNTIHQELALNIHFRCVAGIHGGCG